MEQDLESDLKQITDEMNAEQADREFGQVTPRSPSSLYVSLSRAAFPPLPRSPRSPARLLALSLPACLPTVPVLTPPSLVARPSPLSHVPRPRPHSPLTHLTPPFHPFCQAKASELRNKVERQLKLVNKRCEGLTVKASEIVAENAVVRLKIDDLRKEKLCAC